jgi:Brp/Blh family beta-carotene 15,15'-monooxygenase
VGGLAVTLSRARRTALLRTTVVPSRVVVAVVAVAFTAGLDLPPLLRYGPLLASALVLGIPHGAVDHLVVPRLFGASPSPTWLARVGLLYGVLGVAYLAVWVTVPVLAVWSFIGLTWLHWGQGDLYTAQTVLEFEHTIGRIPALLTILVRGAIPMVVPLLAAPDTYREVLSAVIEVVGADAITLGRSSAAAAVVLGLLLGGWLSTTVRNRRSRRDWLLDVADVALLCWYFWVVPPVFAIGVYFVAWHSLCHVGRLCAFDPVAGARLESGQSAAAAARFGRQAFPLTVVTVVLFLAALGGSLERVDPRSITAVYLVVIAVLTLPHVVVVTLMDVEELRGRNREV